MKVAYKLASKEAGRISDKNNSYYDQGVRFSRLEIGDRVLVRNVGLKGKNNLANKWDSDVCVIKNIPNSDIPVFTVQSTTSRKTRTLHTNMLLPFTMYHHATLICLLFPGHQCQGGKSLRNRNLIYRNLIVQIQKLYRLRLRQLEQIKTIQMIVLVLVILMSKILLCFRMNSMPVKTSVTAPRKQMATAIQRILYLPIVYRISQFHRLCREGLQDLENHPIVSVNGCRNWFLCRNMFYAENRFFNAE